MKHSKFKAYSHKGGVVRSFAITLIIVITMTITSFADVTIGKEWNDSLTGTSANNRALPTVSLTGETSYEKLLNLFYPVGCYFETTDTSFDPNTAWGGTWVEDDGGRVHVAAGSNTANTVTTYGSTPAGTATFNTGEKGGEFKHQITIAELAKHRHLVRNESGAHTLAGGQSSGDSSSWCFTDVPDGPSANGQSGKFYGWYEGGDMPHNNMMPYTVVKRWHRTA